MNVMANITVIPTNGLDLDTSFGPLYWGFLVALVLTGINIVQAYLYFVTSTDRPKTKMIALSMLLLNLTSSALVAQSLYYYLVPHFGSLAPFSKLTNELSAECLISTLMTFISQMYFALQLYNVSNRVQWGGTFTAWAVALSAIITLVFGIACPTIMAVQSHAVLETKGGLFKIFFGIAKGFGALTDIIATVSMCLLLVASRTGFEQTNALINTLIQYVIQRGIIVTLIQLSLFIVFFAAPNHLYWFSFHVNVTKLYANTFFSMLNSREDIQRNHFEREFVQRMSAPGQGHANSKVQRHVPFGDKDRRDELKLEIRHLASSSDRKLEEGVYTGSMPTVTKTVVIRNL